MIYALTWLPDVLQAAGLKVAEVPGWRARGRADMGLVRGVLCHHTATAAPGNMPTLGMLQNGRSDLAGPLAQLGLGRDGTYYVVAAGRANHAGPGVWEGITNGNASFIGIEAENDGVDEPWPDVQMDAYRRGVAAILRKIGARENMCCGHKEYAPGRKRDPDFDMAAFRRQVRALLDGATPAPPIPAADAADRPTLMRSSDASSPSVAVAVAAARTELRLGPGIFDADMEASVRAAQRALDLVPDGIIGPKTWAALDGAKAASGAAAAAPVTATPDSLTPDLPPADDANRPALDTESGGIGPDGKIFAHRFRGGLVTSGITTLEQFLAQQTPQASASIIRVLRAMSPNEGRMEAINTYDDSHLSFGILQWTAGATVGASELPALLALLKTQDADAFDACFGTFGLDVDVQAGASAGLFRLQGTILSAPTQKETLRGVAWAYRFWRAGHHPSLRLCQFDFAARRIDIARALPVAGRPLSDWLTSEYAVALALDQHVNRPNDVTRTLGQAVATLPAGADPATFGDRDERNLVQAYLEARAQTSMTNSRARAAAIEACVAKGKLSSTRGSFKP